MSKIKFAKYEYITKGHSNLGDSMQIIALEHIYEQMGVDLNDVISVSIFDLPDYEGETIILPIVSGVYDPVIPIHELFSEKIVPVFISYVRLSPLTQEEATYLKDYEPIGCRDHYSHDECQRFGIKAYINGCITAGLPERTNQPKDGGSVFFVDAEENVMPYVPEEILKGANIVTHLIRNEPDGFDELEEAKKMYERYKSEARLIVTKRLHCVSPCMAAGIPVVFVRDCLTSNLTWIDKFIPLYTPDRYEKIDWNPQPVKYGNHKENIIQIASARLRNAYELASTSDKMTEFFMQVNREKQFLVQLETEDIKRIKPDNREVFDYSLWGVGNTAFLWHAYMNRNYPNAKLSHVYDKYKHGTEFAGCTVKPMDAIKDNLDEFLFVTVTTPKTVKEIFKYLVEINKPANTYTAGVKLDGW